MTLIQTLLTPEFVIQVSDRRLSYKGEIRDDSYNKAVSWCGMAAVGFTGGFAHVDYRLKESVTNWIAGRLASQETVGSGVDSLDSGMRELFAKLSKWRKFPDLRLTIAMVGIAPDYGNAFLRGLSNFEDGERIFQKPSEAEVFRWGYDVPLHGTQCFYTTAGAYLGRDFNRADEGRKLAQIAQMGGINNAARYMVQIQRRVARKEKSNGKNTVGEDAMVVSIPANLDRRRTILMSNTDTDAIHGGAPNFSFVKAGSFSRERFAPVLACNGSVSEISAWGEGDNQIIRFQQIIPPT